MDFNIDNLWVFKIGSLEIWITRTIFNTWIIMLALIIFAIFVRIKLKKFQQIPKGFQNVIESIIEMFENFIKNNAGKGLLYLAPWFFSLGVFILFANLSGLVGLRPPTSDFATTFALAMSTFILIQIMGLRYQKADYLKGFFSPHPLFFPLNLLGELARPISLSFRLFGNLLAGFILISLYYALTPIAVRFGIPIIFHGYFDLLSGVLQTYIFCILSLMFVKGATE